MKAPLFFPPVATNACSDMKLPEHLQTKYNMDWHGFVIVLDGVCTWEEKARRVE